MIEGGKRELRRKQPWRRNTGAAPTTLPENAAVEVACEIAMEEEIVAKERERERERGWQWSGRSRTPAGDGGVWQGRGEEEDEGARGAVW